MKMNKMYDLIQGLIVSSALLLCLTSCSSDDDGEDFDPEGTVTAVMQVGDGHVDIFNYSTEMWVNTTTDSDWYFDSLNEGLYIYDCGRVNGLSSISEIPESIWVWKKVRGNPEAQAGHGYVIMYKSKWKKDYYARMYIVGRRDHGFLIKYQYPFNPNNESQDNTSLNVSDSKKVFVPLTGC